MPQPLQQDSLSTHDCTPEKLVIVDSSPGDQTELAIRNHPRIDRLARCIVYFRVQGNLRGLTRQRNFALRWVSTDLIVFFDDDVVLLPGCLRDMERVHRELGDQVAGVGARDEFDRTPVTRLWRLRRCLGIVTTLEPGRYCRTGMSIPWGFLPPTDKLVDGDWLPGFAMMWKTALIDQEGFCSEFGGYAQGEDLEFSLRARRKGRLVLAGTARVQHRQHPAGRPDPFRMGYMAIANRYHIHRTGLDDRSWRDVLRFSYAWTLDTFLLLRNLPWPRRTFETALHVAGRVTAAFRILRGSRDAFQV
jgi:GT2 family glycosyltransferase